MFGVMPTVWNREKLHTSKITGQSWILLHLVQRAVPGSGVLVLSDQIFNLENVIRLFSPFETNLAFMGTFLLNPSLRESVLAPYFTRRKYV